MATTEQLVQKSLSVLGQTPGAILVRGPERWQELPPGEVGQVLAIGEDGMPGWYWIDNLPGS